MAYDFSNNLNMMNALSGPLPIFFKWVALLTVISSITSIFTPWLSWALANIPYYTLIYINLWRPFTSCMVEQSLMMGLFALIIMFFILPEIVKEYLKVRKEISRQPSQSLTFSCRISWFKFSTVFAGFLSSASGQTSLNKCTLAASGSCGWSTSSGFVRVIRREE